MTTDWLNYYNRYMQVSSTRTPYHFSIHPSFWNSLPPLLIHSVIILGSLILEIILIQAQKLRNGLLEARASAGVHPSAFLGHATVLQSGNLTHQFLLGLPLNRLIQNGGQLSAFFTENAELAVELILVLALLYAWLQRWNPISGLGTFFDNHAWLFLLVLLLELLKFRLSIYQIWFIGLAPALLFLNHSGDRIINLLLLPAALRGYLGFGKSGGSGSDLARLAGPAGGWAGAISTAVEWPLLFEEIPAVPVLLRCWGLGLGLQLVDRLRHYAPQRVLLHLLLLLHLALGSGHDDWLIVQLLVVFIALTALVVLLLLLSMLLFAVFLLQRLLLIFTWCLFSQLLLLGGLPFKIVDWR